MPGRTKKVVPGTSVSWQNTERIPVRKNGCSGTHTAPRKVTMLMPDADECVSDPACPSQRASSPPGLLFIVASLLVAAKPTISGSGHQAACFAIISRIDSLPRHGDAPTSFTHPVEPLAAGCRCIAFGPRALACFDANEQVQHEPSSSSAQFRGASTRGRGRQRRTSATVSVGGRPITLGGAADAVPWASSCCYGMAKPLQQPLVVYAADTEQRGGFSVSS